MQHFFRRKWQRHFNSIINCNLQIYLQIVAYCTNLQINFLQKRGEDFNLLSIYLFLKIGLWATPSNEITPKELLISLRLWRLFKIKWEILVWNKNGLEMNTKIYLSACLMVNEYHKITYCTRITIRS